MLKGRKLHAQFSIHTWYGFVYHSVAQQEVDVTYRNEKH